MRCNNLCSCGSNIKKNSCCELYIKGKLKPLNPEALMRSRYVAYSKANIDYIVQTMMGSAIKHYNKIDAKKWAKSCHWLGLTVIHCETDGDVGMVEFIAKYRHLGKINQLHERSEFRLIDGCWFYYTGQILT